METGHEMPQITKLETQNSPKVENEPKDVKSELVKEDKNESSVQGGTAVETRREMPEINKLETQNSPKDKVEMELSNEEFRMKNRRAGLLGAYENKSSDLGKYITNLKIQEKSKTHKTTMRWFANSMSKLGIQVLWALNSPGREEDTFVENNTNIYSIKNKIDSLEKLAKGKTLNQKNIRALKDGKLNNLLMKYTTEQFPSIKNPNIELLLDKLGYVHGNAQDKNIYEIPKIKDKSNFYEAIENTINEYNGNREKEIEDKANFYKAIENAINKYKSNREKESEHYFLFGYSRTKKFEAASLLLAKAPISVNQVEILSNSKLGKSLKNAYLDLELLKEENKGKNPESLINAHGGHREVMKSILVKLGYDRKPVKGEYLQFVPDHKRTISNGSRSSKA